MFLRKSYYDTLYLEAMSDTEYCHVPDFYKTCSSPTSAYACQAKPSLVITLYLQISEVPLCHQAQKLKEAITQCV